MIEIRADGWISHEGRLNINSDERPMFLEMLSRQAGKGISVLVRVEGKRRSPAQNGYYYGVVVGMIQNAIKDEWGELLTKDEAHELLKQNCNWKEVVNTATGESVKLAQSTANLSTMEFEEYLEKCRRFAEEYLNVRIPLPNEQTEINL